jgi:cytidylate kinase
MKIAIDGPAGSGKSTIAKIIANRFKITYIDSGAMYRAVTLYILNENIDINDYETIIDKLDQINIEFDYKNNVLLNGIDVSKEIRSLEVTRMVSQVSNYQNVRDKLVEMQRQIASKSNVIMDGRDIGTVVLKDADYKYYLDASVEKRALRRFLELKESGVDIVLEDLIKDIQRRDYLDSNRENSPLTIANDAKVIDTTNYTIDEVIDLIGKDFDNEEFN